MQFKTLAATVALGATLAAATGSPASQCNTGGLQCCNSTGTANSDAISKILGLLGIVVQDVTALVGVNCSPISVIGIGGNSCTAQPVCCTNNSFGGLVALGCSPVDLNL
ncbi:Fruiting body protein SC3 [Psilocybe cubensis]|uniref:Hydrophobin n=2 Tax=Psilocybe cubensis TaxID=181762 RepID=A0A8H7XSY1_PSICU|nr:Fruiting body protein SC3 [Psilocybe cubensis]KAH9475718.1 Fruiting body protein SC3 [Psilocybe cubensis]